MNPDKRGLSLVVALSLALSLIWTAALQELDSSGAAAPIGPQNPLRTIQIADAARQATRDDAHADYWLKVATLLNDDDPALLQSLQIARRERDDQLALAAAQRQARLLLQQQLGADAYRPTIDPNDFSTTITNTYFPMVPGRTMVYERTTAEGIEQIQRLMTYNSVDVDGVSCRVMSVGETLDGDAVEETVDFFAQKTDGSVWYFGEISRKFDGIFLDSLDGSWRAGKDGARPGIVMPANPMVGDIFREEFLLNRAEDVGRVVSVGNTVTVPAGIYSGCIEIESYSPIEPNERERKFYAPGIGLVKEVDLQTGEALELIQIIN